MLVLILELELELELELDLELELVRVLVLVLDLELELVASSLRASASRLPWMSQKTDAPVHVMKRAPRNGRVALSWWGRKSYQ